jgi:hypothetical protein
MEEVEKKFIDWARNYEINVDLTNLSNITNLDCAGKSIYELPD